MNKFKIIFFKIINYNMVDITIWVRLHCGFGFHKIFICLFGLFLWIGHIFSMAGENVSAAGTAQVAATTPSTSGRLSMPEICALASDLLRPFFVLSPPLPFWSPIFFVIFLIVVMIGRRKSRLCYPMIQRGVSLCLLPRFVFLWISLALKLYTDVRLKNGLCWFWTC